MEEKIRVNLSKRTFSLLEKDAENFEFFKKDGSLNKNAFINTLILNYHEDYSSKQRDMLEMIKENIKGISYMKYDEIIDSCYQILNSINQSNVDNSSNNDVHISFRPTKASIHVVDYIENYLLKNTSRSNYYRMMFDSYCLLPQDQREKIIFKSKVDLIQQSIESNKKVFIQTKKSFLNKKDGYVLSPYILTNTKEELYNYLLGEINDTKEHITFRLCRIEHIQMLNEEREFDEKCLNILEKMLKYGPQYNYKKGENERVVIKLTETGIKYFKSMYVHRPIPIHVENDIYTFDCSYSQVFNYFSRFGGHAYILSPKALAENMCKFHQSAYEVYKRKLTK